MILPHFPHGSPVDELGEDQPHQVWFYKYVIGLLAPVLVMLPGFQALWHGSVTIGRAQMKLTGLNASAFAITMFSLAVFLHVRFFWEQWFADVWWITLLKLGAMLTLLTSLGLILVRVGILGIN